MCNCVAQVNKMLEGKNSKLVTAYAPLVKASPDRLVIQTMKIDEKKRGRPALVVATFCPFCGDKCADQA